VIGNGKTTAGSLSAAQQKIVVNGNDGADRIDRIGPGHPRYTQWR